MEQLTAHVNQLHPNPWNPNRMNDRQYAAAKESIEAYGFIDPITVRAHPELSGEYQVIDGEHRWKAAQELGIDTVPIVLITVTDQQAKKLTIILNETRGNADTIDLAQLLDNLSTELDPDELLRGLPYSQAELDELIAMGSFDWDEHLQGASDTTPQDPHDNDFATLRVLIPTDALAVLKQARERIQDETQLHDEEAIAWGQVIELLAAEYLAQ